VVWARSIGSNPVARGSRGGFVGAEISGDVRTGLQILKSRLRLW
jgi:hypothetical protein